MFGYTRTETTTISLLVFCVNILIKLLVTYIAYHFLVWLEAPQWIVIAITASAWVQTSFKLT